MANPQLTLTPQSADAAFEAPSAAANRSLPIHRWTDWIAGFSGQFARSAINQYLPFPRTDSVVMDPFAGVGTTILEAYRLGVNSIGFEINPYAELVCKVKLASVDVSVQALKEAIKRYAELMERLESLDDGSEGVSDSDSLPHPDTCSPAEFKSRIPFFPPPVEKKVLYTIDFLQGLPNPIRDIFRVALGSVIVRVSNYSYEPSLGSRPGAGKELLVDAPVGTVVIEKLLEIAEDIESLQFQMANRSCKPRWVIHSASLFEAERFVKPDSVDLVVTSPPYMNNYHYVRNTRPQLFWIGCINSVKELKTLEEHNFGKFWQTVRASAPIALEFRLPSLEEQILDIRHVNPEKGVYGGGGWANYVATYMNDLYRFCSLMAKLLRVGGTAIIVIGNSVIQGKPMEVENYLCQIADLHNLSSIAVVKLRTRVGSSIVDSGVRLASKTKPELYDTAVILRRSQS